MGKIISDLFIDIFIKMEISGDIIGKFLSYILETLGMGFLLLLMTFLKPIRLWIFRTFTVQMSRATGFKQLTNTYASLYRDVNVELIELRSKLNSSRVEIFQFENGSRFSLSNPVWKITQSYEVVAHGIQYCADCIQRVQVSHLLELVEPFFFDEVKTPGIDLVKDSEDCKIAKYDVDKIPPCRLKYEKINRGVEIFYESSLKDKNGAIFGLITVGYSYKKNLSELELQKLQDSVSRIQVMLNGAFIEGLKK